MLNNTNTLKADYLVSNEVSEKAIWMNIPISKLPPLLKYDRNTIDRPKPKYFYSVDDFLNLPPLEYLIEGHLTLKGFTGLIGPSGHGKSFIALDIACCVSSGISWHGHQTKQGSVIYVVAEGEDGFKDRIRAWLNGHPEIDQDLLKRNLKFVPHAIQLTENNEINELLDNLNELEASPALVIIDTLARCNLGNDENSAQHMSQFVDACNKIQSATQGGVMVIHHTNKGGSEERGSGAFRGAADSVMRVKMNSDMTIILDCVKAKHSASFQNKHFRLKAEPASQSVYIETTTKTKADGADYLDKRERTVLEKIKAQTGEWFFMREIKVLVPEIPDGTIEKVVRNLADKEKLEADGDNKKRRYRIPPSDYLDFDDFNPFTPS